MSNAFSDDGLYETENPVPDDPHGELGIEIVPAGESNTTWTFAPEFYPDDFAQPKERELNRNGKACHGEDVSLKNIKNREFHIAGVILASEIPVFQRLMDHSEVVDLISPITPKGGMECQIKDTELGNLEGWDPITQQWRFEYTVDLVSTGEDEYDNDENAVVTAIVEGQQGSPVTDAVPTQDNR